MITFYILNFAVVLLNTVLGWLPQVTELPWIDSYLVTGIGYVNFISVLIPPIGIMLQGFKVVLVFEVTLMVLRFFRIIR